MHDPKIIAAILAEAVKNGAQDGIITRAWLSAALTALCAARPGVAALLSGEAVAVPRAVLGSLCADAETLLRHNCGDPPHPALKRRYDRDVADILEARRLLAASPWAQEEKRDAE